MYHTALSRLYHVSSRTMYLARRILAISNWIRLTSTLAYSCIIQVLHTRLVLPVLVHKIEARVQESNHLFSLSDQ
jgi:hypothetical protein